MGVHYEFNRTLQSKIEEPLRGVLIRWRTLNFPEPSLYVKQHTLEGEIVETLCELKTGKPIFETKIVTKPGKQKHSSINYRAQGKLRELAHLMDTAGQLEEEIEELDSPYKHIIKQFRRED